MVVGVAVLAFLVLGHRDPFHGWGAGFLALCLNLVITVVAPCVICRAAPAAGAAGVDWI